MALQLTINGRQRTFEHISSGCSLGELLSALELQQDRVAVELNGSICSRPAWSGIVISQNDRLEVVHFVGGG
jgi:sulfur carrier protein